MQQHLVQRRSAAILDIEILLSELIDEVRPSIFEFGPQLDLNRLIVDVHYRVERSIPVARVALIVAFPNHL